jgi:hypothetical protein
MQRILLAAFFRGIGGGLALAATPYILAIGHGAIRTTGRGVGRVRGWAEDAGDGWRYFGELRGHRKMSRQQPVMPDTPASAGAGSWHPEQDGFEVP